MRDTLIEADKLEGLVGKAVGKEKWKLAEKYTKDLESLRSDRRRVLARLYREAAQEQHKGRGMVDTMRLLAETVEASFPGALSDGIEKARIRGHPQTGRFKADSASKPGEVMKLTRPWGSGAASADVFEV